MRLKSCGCVPSHGGLTWFQRLSSGLLLFTFMNLHFFQFSLAGAEQPWQPS